MNRLAIDSGGPSTVYLDVQIATITYLSDYTLYVRFTDGREGAVSLSDLVGKGVFAKLTDQTLFSKAYSTGHAIAWSDEMEIDANQIYLELSENPHATDQ